MTWIVCAVAFVCGLSIAASEVLRPRPTPPRERPKRLHTGLFSNVTEEEFFRGHPGIPTTNPFDPPLPEPRRRRRRSYWVEPDDMEEKFD